jgi:hypothetical protein
MRDLHPNFAATVSTGTIAPAVLVFLDIDGDPVRVWSGHGPLPWAGEVFHGVGNFGTIEPVEEYSDIRAGSCGLTLTGVPGSTLHTLKNLPFKDRTAEIWLALFDGDNALIGVELLVRGTMDVLKIARTPEKSTISITVINELARLKDTWGSLYTDPHQQALHPGDTGLRFVASIQDLQIRI